MSRLRPDDSGMSLIELMVGMAVASIAIAVVFAWLVAATRVDLDQDADFEGLNELRFAKAQMTKELRFADGSLTASNSESIEVWIDVDGNGTGPDSTGEQVIWRIHNGDLIRYTDDDLGTAVTWVSDLDTADSSLNLNGNVAEIVLTLSVEQGATAVLSDRTIETSVTLRNG